MSTKYYYTQDMIQQAMAVTVYDYLVGGSGAYHAIPTNKIDKSTGETIYTCNYDGFDHDSVSITTKGFKHFASGKPGCFYAYEFLKSYCGFSDATNTDRMQIIEELYTATIGTPEKTWEEHCEEIKTRNKPSWRQLSKTEYFSATDLTLLSQEEQAELRPEQIAADAWEKMSVAQKYTLITGFREEKAISVINKKYHKSLPAIAVVEREKGEFEPPIKSEDVSHIKAYLTRTRGLSEECVAFLIKSGYVYESKIDTYTDKKTGQKRTLKNPIYNLVVPGRDNEGNIRYAYKRETWDKDGEFVPKSREGKSPFKGEAYNSDKSFGWCHLNKNSQEIAIFEAPIDAFSMMDLLISQGISTDELPNMVALGGTSTPVLDRILNENEHIKVCILCLDNDYDKGENATGPKIAKELKESLTERGYRTEIALAPCMTKLDKEGKPIYVDGQQQFTKDYNEYLRSKKNQERARAINVKRSNDARS